MTVTRFEQRLVDGYFLEYDDARPGDFAPLCFVPKDKTVVLVLVSTKLGTLEHKNDLKRRIDDAARFMPLDQMCLRAAEFAIRDPRHPGVFLETDDRADRLVLYRAQRTLIEDSSSRYAADCTLSQTRHALSPALLNPANPSREFRNCSNQCASWEPIFSMMV